MDTKTRHLINVLITWPLWYKSIQTEENQSRERKLTSTTYLSSLAPYEIEQKEIMLDYIVVSNEHQKPK